MSENDNLIPDELSLEDQKKAINLQDLVYIKKYIDDNHYTKSDADDTFYNKLQTVDRAFLAERVAFTTVAPSASPALGSFIVCFLTEEPETRYDRVLYLIGG